MSDFLMDLGQNPRARKLIKTAGLPIPMPQKLRRARGAYEDRPLFDQAIAVSGNGELGPVIADTLARAGACPVVIGDDEAGLPYRDPGEAFGRPATVVPVGPVARGTRTRGLVFDATGVENADDLANLYEVLHPLGSTFEECSRVVVLARPAEAAHNAATASARAAVEGFTRSIAKEIGKSGSIANLVWVDAGAEERVPPVLRFFLSPRAAFVTTQAVHVSTLARATEERPRTRVLAGKVALVTGAARGIGRATAEIMAGEGAHVVCLDRPEDDGPVSQVAREISGSVLLVDVSAKDAPQTIGEALRERHGGVDIVVHNAGVTRDKTIRKMKRESWDQAIDINLRAVVDITDALLDGVIRKEGRVVVLSSIAGIAGNLGQTNYAASKSGLLGLVAHLSRETAKRGITVNAIAPGFIETRLTAAIPVMIREGARRLSALGQGGLPEDVGQAITFLSTPGADGVTGNVLRVCGGALVGR
ncbi:MAG: 3-oxoacyl-ACP reductase [Deltaproteobacteria bacterium]|nr:3-oxoacyl-ACP reductase [Deltaproteobacteria bacterium]